MVKALFILDLTVHDYETFVEYIERIPAFIEKHGGQYIVRGEEPTVIEGDWSPQRVVVLEFPSREKAQNFINDSEAQSLFEIRHKATTSKLILVDACI